MKLGRMALTALALLTGAASSIDAQSASKRGYLFGPPQATLTLFGAFAAPSAGSDLYSFSFDQLTLSRGDLATLSKGFDLAVRINLRMDAVFGLAFGRSAHRSEFRDYVDNNDQPIEQTTSLSRVPLGATLRYHLTSRGEAIGSRAWIPARVTPWVGLGGGMMQYRFAQNGDFVDFETLDVFQSQFVSRGWAPFAQGSLGAGWSLTPVLELTGELRYVRASGATGNDFQGFDCIDLSGVSTSVGLTVRF